MLQNDFEKSFPTVYSTAMIRSDLIYYICYIRHYYIIININIYYKVVYKYIGTEKKCHIFKKKFFDNILENLLFVLSVKARQFLFNVTVIFFCKYSKFIPCIKVYYNMEENIKII